ncbi:MAG: ATP phosphoribosyltransferase regulatory subunit [Pseudomonadota bacterium]
MIRRNAVRAEAVRLRAFFEAAGAQPVETDILQPADTLLDLYGEDIRARAYVTSDLLHGERMLRPDFTVPVARMHMSNEIETARYTYAGEVFRKQEINENRATEYLQVGYEIFDGLDDAAADAEVFALFHEALAHLELTAATGDIGILTAAVHDLDTTERRKGALLRHIWRPQRFRDLLNRFAGRTPVTETHRNLMTGEIDALIGTAGPQIGLRGAHEVAACVEALRRDAAEPPISETQVDMLDALLSIETSATDALRHLRDAVVDHSHLSEAVERFARRLEALSGRGIDVEKLAFEASYGRTQMEYYDGFVFGFYADDRPDLPPVANGGRYDALCRILGRGRLTPAVGGVIRPASVLSRLQRMSAA